MDAVLRGIAVYLFLLIIFRISGKRTLAQITTFDFVVLLILSETTQQAMVGEDYSITNAFILIVTLVGVDIGISLWKQRSGQVEKLTEGLPLIIVENGRPIRESMNKARVDDADVLASARCNQGLERMEQIKYAVLERNGEISVIPKQGEGGA